MLVLDSTEAQLRFGSALANSTDPNQPGHPLSARSVASVASRIMASVVLIVSYTEAMAIIIETLLLYCKIKAIIVTIIIIAIRWSLWMAP